MGKAPSLGFGRSSQTGAGARYAATRPLPLWESDSQRNVRVQPCIRPLNAAVLAAGPDVIR
jgi:hypothetical protein